MRERAAEELNPKMGRIRDAEVEQAHGQRLTFAPEVDEVTDFEDQADQVNQQHDAVDLRAGRLAVVTGGCDHPTNDAKHDADRDTHNEAVDEYGHETDPESAIAHLRRTVCRHRRGSVPAGQRGRRLVAAAGRRRRRIAAARRRRGRIAATGRVRRKVAGRWRWWILHAGSLLQDVVTIVPAILSWTACFCGSHSCHSQPMAPMMQNVRTTSRTQMNPRSAALPIVGY